ncbi:YhdP family protein [Hydrogenophaga sp.]|uniref:YhdP family protein n=1 Tax=Hydrogenophaga sp. TaxID=1904254 RepID=UPI0027207E43|nr:YhdP family protein [Hydrogenophaga sp.]MDO8903134.1 YhdP family protein [Hydrogenophaga sp.]
MKQSPASIAPATRILKTFSVAARLLLWLVLASWSLFALTWGTLHWWIVPRIGEWRPELERWASAAVGVPVTVGSIRAETTSVKQGLLPAFVPVIELQDVRLYDAHGRAALELPQVRVALSVASIWRGGVEQVVIDRPVLDVRRTGEGRIEVAGLDLSGSNSEDDDAADWFFSQREFAIRQGTVRWTDDLRGQPPLALSALDFVARHTGRNHQFRLDATPPAEWGDRFSLVARFRQPLLALGQGNQEEAPARWRQWDGDLFADFRRVDVARLRAYVDLSEWDLEVAGGQGALKAWADVKRGAVTGASTELDLRQVQVRLGPTLPALALDEIQGGLAAQWSADGFSFSTDDLRFRTAEGQIWPGGRVRVVHVAGYAGGRPGSTALSADQVDLAALSAIATRLPLDGFAHQMLDSLQPVGRVQGLDARWEPDPWTNGPGLAEAPARVWPGGNYWAKGRVVGLTLRGEKSERRSSRGDYPLPGRPGLVGATVDFDFNREGGKARLDLTDGQLELPGVFEATDLPLQRLQADAVWRVKGERIEVDLDQVRMANADAEGTAKVRWRTSDPDTNPAGTRFPGVLELDATLTRALATSTHRYLPLSVGPDSRRYVREALLGGTSSRVEFRVRGEVDDLPFDTPGSVGVFRIAARLQDVDLAYAPPFLRSEGATPWPALQKVSGQLVLDRASLRITDISAGLQGAPNVSLSRGEVRIDDLSERATLLVKAHAAGPAVEVLEVLKTSPLNDLTGRALTQAQMNGVVDLGFDLSLPLSDVDAAQVRGSVRFPGNDVQISPLSPLLAGATGLLQFTDRGFDITNAQARLYGGVVRFEGGMSADEPGQPSPIRFRGQGTASAVGLQQAGLGFVSRLFLNTSGSTGYAAQLGFRGGEPELIVTSSLQGLALNLPAPLNKAADANMPLRFESAVLSVVGEQASVDRLSVSLGPPAAPVLALQYERDLGQAEPRVLRGSLAAGLREGESAPLPAQGVMANISLDQLDIDQWRHAFSSATGVEVSLPATGASTGTTGPTGDGTLGYLPTTVAVRANRITADGRSFNKVVVGGSRVGTQWRANIDADELNGYVEYRPSGGISAGSIYARLARLDLPPSAATDVEQRLQQPGSVPALDIAVDDLVLGTRRLGRVEIEAVNVGGAGRIREWRLNRLAMRVPEARLSATGNWAALETPTGTTASDAPRRTALNFRLDIDDSGKLLERFGREGVVRGGKGQIEGRIGWAGSPLALDYPSLSGQLRADVASGQFLQVEPGAAKLLGVLSLQALPRRLALDFRDVFSEGFAFDFVRGDARIDKGVMSTNNLQMKGVNAAVLMEGTADIGREEQDLKVVVVPEINAGTAALIATAINPAVGLGTFLAQFLLREPLQSATTQEFRITGSWADPQVVKQVRNVPMTPPPETRKPAPVE